MRFDIVNNINSITEEDFFKLTALFDCSDNRASILKYFMDESILNKLSTEYINTLYKITKELVETRIEHIIETEYSETKLPKGTRVKIKPKYLEPKEDCIYDYENKVGIITYANRFGSNEFNQGWYSYNVKFEGIPNVVVLYRKEFNIIETI
jgi:hypothetical protein|nr:MAG TPA: hypothetical protein [Caudoviricetes sp.]